MIGGHKVDRDRLADELGAVLTNLLKRLDTDGRFDRHVNERLAASMLYGCAKALRARHVPASTIRAILLETFVLTVDDDDPDGNEALWREQCLEVEGLVHEYLDGAVDYTDDGRVILPSVMDDPA